MAPSRSESDDPAPRPTPERGGADSLGSACLLGAVGGLLDAFLYLNHGHVFAGAMTGNAVLTAIAVAGGGNGGQIWHHALPILAFLCGVWLAEMLQARARHHAVTIGLAVEAAGILLASFLPATFPDSLFVFLIALLAAFQIASFRKADRYSYNSTFITGDLRTIIVGLYESLTPEKRAEGLGQFRDIGLVVVCFALGALAAAWLSPRLGNHTLWVAFLALAVVFALALRRSLSGKAARSFPSD